MKKIIIPFLLMFTSLLFAQNGNFSNMPLTFVMPPASADFSAIALNQLQTKFSEASVLHGFASAGYDNNFVMYPIFLFKDLKEEEISFQNVVTVTLDMNLFIKQTDKNLVMATSSRLLNGVGRDKASAIKKALESVKPTDVGFRIFFETAKPKIAQYFESNIDEIGKKASDLLKKEQYGAAMALWKSIPAAATNANKVAIAQYPKAYDAHLMLHCTQKLRVIESQIRLKQYQTGLDLIKKMDPIVPCQEEKDKWASVALAKMDRNASIDWDLFKVQILEPKRLQKLRDEIAKEVMDGYLKTQKSAVEYNNIAN
jgi:hypothetical protein